MESATSGAEQFMFRTGQLRHESNIFWSIEFKNYHGLKSVEDIPFVSVDTVACNRFTPPQLEHYFSLMKYVKPLMRDTVSFHLISMVMLLDTSNLTDDNPLPDKYGESSEKLSDNDHAIVEERFQGIKALQKHYVNLFHDHCIRHKKREIESLGGTEEELNRTMSNIKHISNLIALLIK